MELVVKGAWVALATPFDAKGNVDQKRLQQLVSWHQRQGTDGLLCCATTGEGITLSEKERKKVAALCIEAADGKMPVVVNTGTADTRQSVRLTEQMLELGASGCMATAPYYNRPTQKGCILHFQEIAKVGLPLIVYNNPARTTKLEVETIEEIVQIPGVAAYKDSSGDLAFIRKVKKVCPLPLLSGDDHLTYETLKEGGDGAISVIGNIVPKSWKKMISFALNKNWEESKKIADRYVPLIKAIFKEINPQGIKFAMGWLGLCRNDVRLPLIGASIETAKEIRRALVALSLLHLKFPHETAAASAAFPDG